VFDIFRKGKYKSRNKSWKPERVGSFNMGWRILVYYPEPEARDKIYKYPPTHVKIQNTISLATKRS
jgi:hypothetical protein